MNSRKEAKHRVVALHVKEVIDHYFVKLDVRVHFIATHNIEQSIKLNPKYLTPVPFFAVVLTVINIFLLYSPHTDTVTPI